MSAPVTLVAATPTQDEIVAAFRAAADNTVRVMPPLVAEQVRRELLAVATTVAATGDELSRVLVAHWAERVDEINAYAARAREFVEHEVFVTGASPDESCFTAPADDLEHALGAESWLPGCGVAHRSTIYLHGPWVIDRPARNGAAA